MYSRMALGAVIAVTVSLTPAPASSSQTATASAAKAGIKQLMATFKKADLIGSGGWQSAVAQSTVETYEQTTGDASYLGDIATTYNRYHADYHGHPDFEDDFTDDTAWWGLAWLQAYLITRQSRYLQVAEADADYIHRYWVTSASTCGGAGGVLWKITEPHSKGAISQGLFLELTAWLHNEIPHDTRYLGWAKAEWSWLSRSGLIDSSNNLVWNNFSRSKCAPTGTYLSYNQGTVVAGLTQLYRATGKRSLLTEAEKIASATIAYLAPYGVLADRCQPSHCGSNGQEFKGIFVRDLKILSTTASLSRYNTFFYVQGTSVRDRDATAADKFGLDWAGPRPTCPAKGPNPCTSATQTSAEEALIADLRRR